MVYLRSCEEREVCALLLTMIPNDEDSSATRLQKSLREIIAATDVGARIPSERHLAEKFGVARMTLRRAVGQLILEGLLERRHGSGTYVLAQPAVRLLGLTSFTSDMQERGMKPASRTLALSRGAAGEKLARELGTTPATPVVGFTRLRFADGQPMAVETVWIASHHVPGLTVSDLDGSFYSLLAARYGRAPQAADVTITPVLPSESISTHLGTDPHAPCLHIRVTSRDRDGRVFMLASCYYHGERYRLHAELLSGAFAPIGQTERRTA